MQGSKLYVGNLNYSVTGEQLKELFSKYGAIQDAVVIQDKYTNRSKGFGFIEFSSSEEAEKAVNELNGQEFEGRSLKVNEAKSRSDDDRRSGGFRD